MGLPPDAVVLTKPDRVFELPSSIISRKVQSLGGEEALGGLERTESNIWYFRDGSAVVYNSRMREAFRVFGAIYAKWIALGGLAWGTPDTDELATPDGIGRFNHFNNNSASI